MIYAAKFSIDEKELDKIEKTLSKYGAEKSKDAWILKLGEGKLFFYMKDKKLVMSNISSQEFNRYYSKEKLRDYPPFSYLSSKYPSKDITRIFIDIGNIIGRLVGVRYSSCMIFVQTYEKGKFIYSLEVM